jgi:hypothetical protein
MGRTSKSQQQQGGRKRVKHLKLSVSGLSLLKELPPKKV